MDVRLPSGLASGALFYEAADSNLRYQQNLPKIGIAAVVVAGVRNRIEDLRPIVAAMIQALERIETGQVIEI